MPIVQFSNRDVLMGTVVDPAWYVVRIDSVGEEPSKDKNSTNYPPEGTIIKNADDGNVKFADVPIKWWFNSKAIGRAIPFLRAFGVEPEAGARIDLAAATGQYLEMFIGNKMFEGRVINDVTGEYRPLSEKNR